MRSVSVSGDQQHRLAVELVPDDLATDPTIARPLDRLGRRLNRLHLVDSGLVEQARLHRVEARRELAPEVGGDEDLVNRRWSPSDREVHTLVEPTVAARLAHLDLVIDYEPGPRDTVDVGIAALEPGTTRNHAYVAMTRGRRTNVAVIPDATGTLDPAQALTEMIARTPRRESALGVRKRLHDEAGVPEPPLDLPGVAPIDSEHAAKVRAIQQRLGALQAPRPGQELGL